MSEQQENMQYGFVDYMCGKWSDTMVDTYNRYNDAVNKAIRLNPSAERGSMGWHEIEFYKDQLHKAFMQLCGVAKRK